MSIAAQIGLLFAEEDEKLTRELCMHFAGMRRSGQVELIGSPASNSRLEQDDITSLDILLVLISQDFIANDFLVEMALYADRIKDQHQRIVPIVLRDVDWERDLPRIGAKVALPRNGKSVARQNRDEAFTEIAREIRSVIERHYAH